MPTDTRSMLDSRKFKALLLAVILIGIPIVCMGAALAAGRVTVVEFVDLTKVAFGSLAAVVAVFMGAVAHEDAARAVTPPITAGGDVTVNNPPAGGSMPPTGGTTVVQVPSPPAAPRGFGSLAPVTRKAGIAGAALMALALLGCTGVFKQDAKTALDVEQAACVLANVALDVPALRTICRISDALDPELQKLLAAGRKVAASKGAPVCRTAGAP
jgi:hypothetical protein